MFLWGFVCSLATAVFQDFGYITSRIAVRKTNDPMRLLVHSQIMMGGIGLLCLPVLLFFELPLSRDFIVPFLLVVSGSGAGQYFFMRAEREIEPSRLSGMMGFRVVLLAVITSILPGYHYRFLQWTGIVLAAVSAVVLNWEKGSIRTGGMRSIGMALFCYCISDLNVCEMVRGFGLVSAVISALYAVFLVNIVTGLILILFFRIRTEAFRESLPYASVWNVKQFFLYMSYTLIGPVHANVILAIRGPLSVLLAMLFGKMHWQSGEKPPGPGIWIRRLAATVIMAAAIILYTVG